MIVVGIDPGINGLGVAIIDDGKLVRALYIPAEKICKYQYLGTLPGFTKFLSWLQYADRLVIEIPQVYRPQFQKGRQSDLIHLAYAAGAIAAAATLCLKSIIPVEPRIWKGQVKKEVMQARLIKELSATELAKVELPSAKSLHHNVWDGIGLAKWGVSCR